MMIDDKIWDGKLLCDFNTTAAMISVLFSGKINKEETLSPQQQRIIQDTKFIDSSLERHLKTKKNHWKAIATSSTKKIDKKSREVLIEKIYSKTILSLGLAISSGTTTLDNVANDEVYLKDQIYNFEKSIRPRLPGKRNEKELTLKNKIDFVKKRQWLVNAFKNRIHR